MADKHVWTCQIWKWHLHVSEVSPGLPSPVGVVDEYGAVGDRAVPSDLQAVDVAQVDGEVDEEASLDKCCKSVK